MEFCDDCGSMMKTDGDVWVCGSCGSETARQVCDDCGSMMNTDGDVWVCGSCGNKIDREEVAKQQSVTEDQQHSEIVDTSEVDAEDVGPTTDARCPECENDRAFWEMKQIRAADESETRFFTCTECDHKWREDDH